MKNKVIDLVKKVIILIKKFFTTNTKMKLLVAYLAANLLYITIGSYIFITKQINPKFDYKQFSLGLRNILVLNAIVFLVILFEKKYKKNWAHLGIVVLGIVRSCCNLVCI